MSCITGYELAKKDNDFIYHERIPDIKSLPVIQKAAVAKALPVNNPIGPKFKGTNRFMCFLDVEGE